MVNRHLNYQQLETPHSFLGGVPLTHEKQKKNYNNW
jgi:hypothetical protein